MQDLIGRTLGHYRIVEKIGEGGMGEVYRARDERLDRDVAIKVLPEALAADQDRLRRFEREAKAVATLSHPNILEIFDFDTEGDVTFAVTELLEGETLREHLQKSSGSLPWRRVQEIGAAVANGLGAAHSKGVVHRDIKPSNIFVCSDGWVKILDFGLAATHEIVDSEAATGSFEAPLTHKGSVMGTVGYMSPEQVRGEPADSRTDIFALGCVLYEMLTGHRAFKRDTTAEIMTAILREEPRSFSESDVQVAPEVAKTVRRCLEKNPQRRFQSASDLAFALEEITQSATLPDFSTLANSTRRRWFSVGAVAMAVVIVAVGFWVIRDEATNDRSSLDPKKVVLAEFNNRTGDPSLDALGTLVSEALAEGASGIGDFSVVPSPASFRQQTVGGETNSGSRALRGLAEETGAGLVVSGAYYLLEDDLRFQAQLTDATAGEVLYSAPAVTGPRDSLGDIIEEVRQRVLGATAWHFYSDKSSLWTPPLLDAFLEYVRCRTVFMQDLEAEVHHLQRAIDLDPNFFKARISFYYVFGNRRLCEQAAQVLREMEPLATRFTPYERLQFQAAQGTAAGRMTDVVQARREMNALSGGREKYQQGISEIFVNRPRATVAILSEIPYPSDAAPRSQSSWSFWWLARAHHMLGDYEEELQVAEQGITHYPTQFIFHGRKAAALAAMGRLEEVDLLIDETELVQTESSVMLVMLDAAGELRANGYRESALLMAERAVDWFDDQRPDRQTELRPELADALVHAERWGEAKDVADDILLRFSKEGVSSLGEGEERVVEEGHRSAGGFWWGDRGLAVSLGRVGTLAARLGDVDKAQQMAERLRDFESSCPAGNRTYQRACIAAQLGDRSEAMRLLKLAVSQGYVGFWGMRADINLEPLWDDPEFQELLRPKG